MFREIEKAFKPHFTEERRLSNSDQHHTAGGRGEPREDSTACVSAREPEAMTECVCPLLAMPQPCTSFFSISSLLPKGLTFPPSPLSQVPKKGFLDCTNDSILDTVAFLTSVTEFLPKVSLQSFMF